MRLASDLSSRAKGDLFGDSVLLRTSKRGGLGVRQVSSLPSMNDIQASNP
jgi:hypothetical protein